MKPGRPNRLVVDGEIEGDIALAEKWETVALALVLEWEGITRLTRCSDTTEGLEIKIVAFILMPSSCGGMARLSDVILSPFSEFRPT